METIVLAPGHTIKISLPCTLRYLNVGTELVQAILSRLPEPPDERTLAGVQLAVQEVCANIVENAADESSRFDLVVGLDEQADRLVIETYDDGASFNPQQVAVPTVGVEQVGGYGLFLIKMAMDAVGYFARGGLAWESIANDDWREIPHQPALRNHWRKKKNLTPGSES